MITNTPISDTDKRKWLISSIRGHEQLYSAATMYMIVQQTTGSFTKVMSYDDFFSMILSTAQVLDQNAKDNAQHKCKTNKATKGNSSTKEDSKKHPNLAKSSDTRFSEKDVWAKMSQEEHSNHIEKFHSKPSPSLTKVQANGTRAANGSKITNNIDSTPQATSSDDASTKGLSVTSPGYMLRSLLSVNKASQAGTKENRLAPGTNIILNRQMFKSCMANCTNHISKHVQASCIGSLIDGGCNGALAGDDVVVVLEESTQLYWNC